MQSAKTVALKEPYRSEGWKQNVLRCQALKQIQARLTKGRHTLYIRFIRQMRS